MLKEFEGQMPKIDKKAHAFESADLIGKVEMKEYSSAWFNVTIRGDVNRIEVGRYSNIQDNCCLHVADDYACIVGDLDGSVIGHGSIVAAGAVVTKGTKVPPFSLVAGIPAKVIKTLDESNLDNIHAQAVKYKDLWSKRHNIMPDIDGETYHGEKIV